MVIERLDRADGQHGQEREAHVGRTQRFQHARRQREREPLSAELRRPGDGAPALLDKAAICLGIAGRRGDHAVHAARTLGIADSVERSPFPGGKCTNPLGNRLDHVRRRRAVAFIGGQLVNSGADAHGKDLVFGRGDKAHALFSLAASAQRYSGKP